ncbi:MAG: toxin-antitoxin system YwqK family antitoxin [Pseudobacter sp.]|uniref:toxin-antitoxin system YwqK family antitoxin n=1 Tax=Pseudobacter sp. TaxID=2045420 RepID=UPI003F7E23B4
MNKTVMKFLCLSLLVCLAISAQARQPKYTKKHFVRNYDSSEFKSTGPVKDGLIKTYFVTEVSIYDVDDNNTTHVRGNVRALLNIESEVKRGKRNGITRQYLIDSADHNKRFLIAEQTYVNDKLNGPWIWYNLRGRKVQSDNFVNDSLSGVSQQFWIDGYTIMKEHEYLDGVRKFIAREYHKNGKVARETTILNNEPNGEVKEYYESGILKDRFIVKGEKRDGLRIYYYPDGKPWIEQIYKMDKAWTIVANYDSKGNKRDAGTLKEGNGTVIFYDDDTTVREVVTYRNGEKI